MRIRWGRIIIAALVAEPGAIAILVALVALTGPDNAKDAQKYAERLGPWVGPIAGAILCYIGGFWVARGSAGHKLYHGLFLGIAVAVLEAAFLIAAQTPYQFLFLASDLGKLLAAILGAWTATRLEKETPITSS